MGLSRQTPMVLYAVDRGMYGGLSDSGFCGLGVRRVRDLARGFGFSGVP